MKEIVELRRHFRRIAEKGWLEMKTTAEIIKYLKKLGFEIHYGREIHTRRLGLPAEEEFVNHIKILQNMDYDFDISEILEGYTGCIAKISSKNRGKTIGLRFDIDALPIHESEDLDHIPTKLGFGSLDENTAHACGHDGHIAIGLQIAKYISENIEKLNGEYIIVFQPAEEGTHGAASMVETEFFDNIDYFIGSHIGMGEKDNCIGVGTEDFLATYKYDVEYKGVSSHAGSAPECGKNALLAACSATLNLHTLTQYGGGIARVNVGKLVAGTGRNLIAGSATMEMELRSDSSEILEDLDGKALNILKANAMAYGLSYEIKKVGAASAFTSKHRDFILQLSDFLESKGYNIDRFPKFNASEDISYMLEKTEDNGGTGIHFLFGTELKAPHHNDKFDYNEDVLERGYCVLKETIRYINKRV